MLEFTVVVFCLVLNAFFAAFEMAFVTVSREDFNTAPEKYTHLIKKIFSLKKNPERTLSVIQIGITLVGAVSAAVGGNGVVENLAPVLERNYQFSPTLSEAISVVTIIVPLTYFSVVFGELVPKSIALNNPRPVLFYGMNILMVMDKFLSPAITFLEKSTFLILKLLRISDLSEEVDTQSSVTISYLPRYHQKFVLNLIELHNKRAKDAMIPWDQVVCLDFADEEEQVLEKIKKSSHSQFPVIDAGVVVGILFVKDFIRPEQENLWPWQNYIKPARSAKSSDKMLDVVLKLEQQAQSLIIIRDTEGEHVGIMSSHDVLKEILSRRNQ